MKRFKLYLALFIFVVMGITLYLTTSKLKADANRDRKLADASHEVEIVVLKAEYIKGGYTNLLRIVDAKANVVCWMAESEAGISITCIPRGDTKL